MAEDIGVYAEPEVEVRQLTINNPFLVVASDGVFEFLSNQDVLNLVSLHDDKHKDYKAALLFGFQHIPGAEEG